jgi:hypothetical protein
MYTNIENLNYDNNDPYVTFTLTQEQYVTDFAKDFSYDGHIPHETWVWSKFVIYDPTDEEGTKREDVFYIEVVSNGQSFTEFCDYADLTVVADTEKSSMNYYTVGQMNSILIQTRIDGWTAVGDECHMMTYVAVEVQYPN